MENPMDLPAAKAAKLVAREVPELDKNGEPTGKRVRQEIGAEEVFACRVRDTQVAVVTTAGERLIGTTAGR